MRIHAICVAKNEGDVIGHCFEQALATWADVIYVYDNGSDDDTWDVVRRFPQDRVVPWKQDATPFRESHRGTVFNAFRDRARPGDWWCRLDADEFYVNSPKEFLTVLPRRYQLVWSRMINYVITHADLERIDFSRPASEVLPQLRYYAANFAEPRFFRYRRRLVWPADGSWPVHVGVPAPGQLLMRHYRYRSPAQIQRRLGTRSEALRNGYPVLAHWESANPDDWRSKIGDGSKLAYDAGDGHFVVDETNAPSHLEAPVKRWVKMALHTLGIWP